MEVSGMVKNLQAIIALGLIGFLAWALMLSLFLSTQNQENSTGFATLEQNNQVLQQNYAQLSQDYENLKINLANTQSQYEKLRQENEKLKNVNTGTVKYLDESFLESIYSAKLPYILMEGRKSKIAFKKLDGNIQFWELPTDTLELFILQGYLMRNVSINDLRLLGRSDLANKFNNESKTVLLQGDNGESFQVLDQRPYIETKQFETVAKKLYTEAGSDEKFIAEVFNLVKQITVYSTELQDTPRFPIETLIEGGGDCEDTSILVASILKAAKPEWKIQIVYMDTTNIKNPNSINHALVYVDTGSYKTFIETTSKTTMNPYYEGMYAWYFDV